MAIKQISSESESSTGLEFLNDWLEVKTSKEKQILNGQSFAVKSISVSQSGKGFTCVTPAFMTFFWKKSIEGQIIQDWLTNSEGFLPVIVLDLDRKSKCVLGEDDDQTVYFEQVAKGSNRYKIYDDPHSKYTGREKELTDSEPVDKVVSEQSDTTKPKK